MAYKRYQIYGLLLALVTPTFGFINCAKTPDQDFLDECCSPIKVIESDVKKKCSQERNEDCIMECIFNETQLIEDGELNSGHLEVALTALLENDPDYIPIVTEGYEKCFSMAKKQIGEKHSSAENCNTLPSFVISCVRMHTFVNCPADRWKTSLACKEAKSFIEYCQLAKGKV